MNEKQGVVYYRLSKFRAIEDFIEEFWNIM